MNVLSFMSFLVLGITILTMIFGVIAYFLYKARERKQKRDEVTYEDVLDSEGEAYLFFESSKKKPV